MNKIIIPEISKQIYKEDVLNVISDEYSLIGPIWTNHQLEWINGIYQSFNDHDKFLIIIYLINKTLNFYSRNFTKVSYENFYEKNTIEIERFNIKEIALNLKLPKESARRKIIELEKDGIIKRGKKKIIIDRSIYSNFKPTKSIIRTSRFLSSISKILNQNKILAKSYDTENLELIIKKNFSYIWKLYYELQIPFLISFKKIFGDVETFHIFGTCVVNEHLSSKKFNKVKLKRLEFIKTLSLTKKGINAMSISDISGIPRATVVRKLNKLIKLNRLKINDKKQYTSNKSFINELEPKQYEVLKALSDFITEVFNLLIQEDNKSNNQFEVPVYLKSF